MATIGERISACAMSSKEETAIGLPASAAETVAALSRDSRAKSAPFQPRRVISRCNASGSTGWLIGTTCANRKPSLQDTPAARSNLSRGSSDDRTSLGSQVQRVR